MGPDCRDAIESLIECIVYRNFGLMLISAEFARSQKELTAEIGKNWQKDYLVGHEYVVAHQSCCHKYGKDIGGKCRGIDSKRHVAESKNAIVSP